MPDHASAAATLAWGRATAGRLTRGERLRLLAPILRNTVQFTAGRLRLALGLRPRRQAALDLERLRWPDSTLAQAAEQACRAQASLAVVNHSLRTFVFGLALAELDVIAVDSEELYITSLLHDLALETPTPNCCFAVAGGQRALELLTSAGAATEQATRIAAAVTAHLTPGVDPRQAPLPGLTAAGALLDLAGMRLWDCAPEFVAATVARYPRAQAKTTIAAALRREAAHFPAGRTRLINQAALFPWLIRLAPFDE